MKSTYSHLKQATTLSTVCIQVPRCVHHRWIACRVTRAERQAPRCGTVCRSSLPRSYIRSSATVPREVASRQLQACCRCDATDVHQAHERSLCASATRAPSIYSASLHQRGTAWSAPTASSALASCGLCRTSAHASPLTSTATRHQYNIAAVSTT